MIKATRLRCDDSKINRNALAEDLQICLAVFRIESSLESKKRFVKRTKHLTQVKTIARKLRSLLGVQADDWNEMGIEWVRLEQYDELDCEPSEEPAVQRVIGLLNAPMSPVFIHNELIDQLDSLIFETTQLLAEGIDQPPFRDAHTPRERLVGKNLPLLFEAHFGRSAGGGRTGPYNRFAACAAGMMRISRPAATTIAKAKKDVELKYSWRKPTGKALTSA